MNDTGRSARAAGTGLHAPKATFARARGSIGQGKQSFDHLTTEPPPIQINGAGPSSRPECLSCRRLCDCRPVSARQADREFGEFALPAVDFYRAAVLLGDDVPCDRQPEPGAFAGRLGGDKRLKQFVPDLRRDAGAVVAHPDLYFAAEIACRHLHRRPKARAGAIALPLTSDISHVWRVPG